MICKIGKKDKRTRETTLGGNTIIQVKLINTRSYRTEKNLDQVDQRMGVNVHSITEATRISYKGHSFQTS